MAESTGAMHDAAAGAVPVRRGVRKDRERAIVDATLEELLESGYEALTMDRVAARAQVGKATIYRRWPGRRELVIDALRQRASSVPVPPPVGRDLREDLINLMRLSAAVTGGESARLVVGVLNAARKDREIERALRSEVPAARREYCAQVVQLAIARGEVAPTVSPNAVFDLIMGKLVYLSLFQGREPNEDELVQFVDDVLLPVLYHAKQAEQ